MVPERRLASLIAAAVVAVTKDPGLSIAGAGVPDQGLPIDMIGIAISAVGARLPVVLRLARSRIKSLVKAKSSPGLAVLSADRSPGLAFDTLPADGSPGLAVNALLAA